MAVYTHLSEAQIGEFLRGYDLGALEAFEGIRQGVENTNYHVFTDRGRFILTVFEKRVAATDLPFFFAFTDHLAARGIPCPKGMADRQGRVVGEIAGKHAAVISFLNGRGLEAAEIAPAHCRALGETVARMHRAALDFSQGRVNSMALSAWKDLAAKTEARANEVAPGLAETIAEELAFLEANWPDALPRGVVHADIFPDNVFFDGETLSGVIDFYFSATDFLAYDLAITINAWCFDAAHGFDARKHAALMEGYEAVRPLSDAERAAMGVMGRGAALRILMTRLYDWLNTPPDAVVQKKDPLEYLKKLDFYRDATGAVRRA